MEHYCTLFDCGFLPQGIALHASLRRHAQPFTLWVLCLDVETHVALRALRLDGMRLLLLADCETAELKVARSNRSHGEYCWTLASHVFTFVFDRDPGVHRLTYLDADVFFFGSPQSFFDEFDRAGKSILITEHAYEPAYAHYLATMGRYCVQFVTFNCEAESLRVLAFWQQQTRASCTSQRDAGAFGDQQYLDDWPVKYPNLVHVLEHRGRTLAPWNGDYTMRHEDPAAVVLFHFHGFRIISSRWIQWGLGYPLEEARTQRLYSAYHAEIASAMALIRREVRGFSPRYFPPRLVGWLRFARHWLRGRLYVRRYA